MKRLKRRPQYEDVVFSNHLFQNYLFDANEKDEIVIKKIKDSILNNDYETERTKLRRIGTIVKTIAFTTYFWFMVFLIIKAIQGSLV